jgi:hypothetical protein
LRKVITVCFLLLRADFREAPVSGDVA